MAEPQAPSGPVAKYYNATVEADPGVFEETYLSLAPLPEPAADFSWSRAVFEAERYPELAGRLREKQRELRRVFFRNIDFAKARSVLDFGCGLGTDLIVLAKRHPHLRCTGYSISSGHAGIAAARVRAEGLQERVSIAERDSSADAFPGSFDAIFGIEVAHHIQNKADGPASAAHRRLRGCQRRNRQLPSRSASRCDAGRRTGAGSGRGELRAGR
jgi:SAM-dependent methyltransferase